MIIKPKQRGFICTTAHPVGCAAAVKQQIEIAKQQQKPSKCPQRVLVIGASTGYGLSTRIAAAFSGGAATIGVFFEKPATEKKTASAGWYNTAAFDRFAKEEGLYAKHINADAFATETKEKTIALIQQDLGQVDLVVYSLASPVRRLPETGELVKSTLKPIDTTYHSKAIDIAKHEVTTASIEPATEKEIQDTVTVMGGQDWELWIQAMKEADVLAPGCQTLAYSYIGTDLTFPIYWDGTIGRAKKDLQRAAHTLNEQLTDIQGAAYVTVMKSVVTQASAAIPMLPLYLSMVFKKMRAEHVHEGCIEQALRLLKDRIAADVMPLDAEGRIRLDDWELQDNIQQHCRALWPEVTTGNLHELTDYQLYQQEFLRLFGFEQDDVDYTQEVDHQVNFDVITLL